MPAKTAPRKPIRKRSSPPAAASERLHKLLARHGVASRRASEVMILQGRVKVNDKPATLGQQVSTQDKIKVDGKLLKTRAAAQVRARVLLYNKPDGQMCTRRDPEGRPTIFDTIPEMKSGRWVSVGRLDYHTQGLLLLTNSGELAERLMHPRYQVEREYAVRIDGELSPEQIDALKTGIQLSDGLAQAKEVVDRGGEGRNHWYHVTLTEGRNREVRRLFEALGLRIARLIRVRYGTVTLPRALRRGGWMELPAHEVNAILKSADLASMSLSERTEKRCKRRIKQPRRPVSPERVGVRGKSG